MAQWQARPRRMSGHFPLAAQELRTASLGLRREGHRSLAMAGVRPVEVLGAAVQAVAHRFPSLSKHARSSIWKGASQETAGAIATDD